jgi:dipeptidyl-peptidase-4
MVIGLLIITSSISAKEVNKITLENIYLEGEFNTKRLVQLKPMKDGEHFTVLEGYNSIIKYSYTSEHAIDTIFTTRIYNKIYPVYISDYAFNSDETMLLFSIAKQKIYRHSFSAYYHIYNLNDSNITPLSSGDRQRLATFSPDGNKVGYVFDNNLYYKDLLRDTTIKVTHDGKRNEIINGAPDWVYEEEFAFTKAFAWSPDSRKIAYYKFNESQVRQFSIQLYDSLYPGLFKYKYPKAGEDNSIVNIHVYDINTGNTKTIDIGPDTDRYIPGIQWTTDPDMLCIKRLNRLQNKLDIILADANTGESEIIHTEENKYYISELPENHITFLDSSNRFILMSETDGYMHFYLYDIKGNLINRITGGNWTADEFMGVDTDKGLLYYNSTEESPLQRNVYSIKLDGSGKRQITKKTGHNRIVFSNDYKYYINYHSTANTPENITVHDVSGKLLRVIQDNSALSDKIKSYGFVKKEFIKIPVSDNLELNAWILKPADFKKTKEYPVFIYVYGGPGSQEVLDEWQSGLPWHQMLVQKGYIVVCVDNRGTAGRGEEFGKCIYMQLGKLETEDLIKSARYIANLPYIDKTRIGIFGASYGGYLALLCLAHGNGIFKMGIAYAPVTDWRFYDTIYTERYMRTPRENGKGYEESSVLNVADRIRGNLLLIHGTADDNVHLQHTMFLIEKLVQYNINYDLLLYPGKKHGTRGVKSRYNLYKNITDFIYQNL